MTNCSLQYIGSLPPPHLYNDEVVSTWSMFATAQNGYQFLLTDEKSAAELDSYAKADEHAVSDPLPLLLQFADEWNKKGAKAEVPFILATTYALVLTSFARKDRILGTQKRYLAAHWAQLKKQGR
jgi:hypothetical protein